MMLTGSYTLNRMPAMSASTSGETSVQASLQVSSEPSASTTANRSARRPGSTAPRTCLVQSDSMRALTVGPAALQEQHPTTGSIMAAATINLVPCFVAFAILPRYLVRSVNMTDLK